jgi:hypothetical protein
MSSIVIGVIEYFDQQAYSKVDAEGRFGSSARLKAAGTAVNGGL